MLFISQKYYKLIAIDSLKQKKYGYSSKKQFCSKLKKGLWHNNVFIAEKQQKIILNFYLDSLNMTE